MKNTLLISILILSALSSFSQHSIKGKIVDNNRHPVASASVIFQRKSDNSIKQSSITDSTGTFLLSPKQTRNHQIRVSSIGFETTVVELTDSIYKDTTMLIMLINHHNQLNEVNIYSRRPLIERKIDRVIFNVENSLSSVGGDGIDALSKAPGVRINDNGIDIIGKNTIKVMVNGKYIELSGTELINYVKSISSEDIKRIEIITNPSARYEAEGNSGLIDIILKKNMTLGFNGIINTGIILASKYTTGITGILNYNSNKLHINSTVTGVYSELKSLSSNELSTAAATWNQQTASFINFKGLRGDLRLDYDFTKNTALGLKFGESASKNFINSNSEGRFYTRSVNSLDSTLINKNTDELRYTIRTMEFYLDHLLDTLGKKIEFASSYLTYGTNDGRLFNSNSLNAKNELLNSYFPVESNEHEDINIFTNKLDFMLPMKFLSLELGAKISSIKNKDRLLYNVPLGSESYNDNFFSYSEYTESLYSSIAKDFNQWSIKIGLRMEATQTKGSSPIEELSQESNYLQLFPSLFLKHDINKDQVLSIAYGRRINRPDYSLLNPARIFTSVNSYTEGNPYLRPSYSNNFEVNHNYKGWLNTSIYSNFVAHGFGMLNLWDAENKTESFVLKNYGNSYNLGVSETVTINKIIWWENNNQFNFYLSRSKFDGITQEAVKQFSGYISTDNTFTLNAKKTIMANATFWYQFPDQSNFLINQSYYSMDLSFRARFLNRKLTLALNAADVFKTSERKSNGVINGITQANSLYRDNRKTRMSIIYRFGDGKRNKASRESDDSEIGRIKQSI